MSGLEGIRVTAAIADSEPAQTVGNVLAIVNEIEAMLETLVLSGESASIDLRNLPMAPGDYEILRRILGEGEVSSVVQALGPTRVHETAVSGVWWVSHCNSDEEVVAEFIEVTRVPAILTTHADDVRDGLETLRRRLSEACRPE